MAVVPALGCVLLIPLLVLVRTALMMGFVLVAGIIQGCTSGDWPDLATWCAAVRDLRAERCARCAGHGPVGRRLWREAVRRRGG